MRNVLRGSCIAVVSVGLAVVGFGQTIQVNQNNRTIAVTVTDKATEQADSATVHVGFEVYGPDSDSTYAAGSRASNAIIGALNKAGVANDGIQSEGQNLRQNFQFDEKESEAERAQRRYVLTQSWTVKTSAADAPKVLHTAVEAGANNSGQIDWDVKDRPALQARAAAKALKHAQAVAEQMAGGLNARLGALLYASNQVPETPAPPPIPLKRFASLQNAAVKPLAIRPQQIEENATVYAVFAIQ